MTAYSNPASGGSGASSGNGASKALSFWRQDKLTYTPPNTNSAIWTYIVNGNYMYVAIDTGGILVLDITDPAHPSEVTVVRNRTSANAQSSISMMQFVIIGTTLLACSRTVNWSINNATGMLAAYDISSPALPVWVSTYQPPDMSPKPVVTGSGYGNNWYQGIVQIGSTNEVALASQFAGLTIVDVSNPAAMTVTSTYTNTELDLVFNKPGDIYWETSKITYGTFNSKNWVFLANHGNGVMAVDVTNTSAPTNPIRFDAPLYNGTQLRARDVEISGNYLFSCNNTQNSNTSPERGLLAIDITNPEIVDVTDWVHTKIADADVDTWIEAGDKPILGIEINGNYAYLANGQRGTAVFDISTPSRPQYLGLFGTSMDAATNLYRSFVFTKNNRTWCYYGDGKEGAAQKFNIYVDEVLNA